MQFLYPSILWGLTALAIPLIVHLFNFRRTKKVFFTNVAFLKKVETETSSFRKLKQWLIMAARMLTIACLVMAFAQPFLPAANQKNIKGNIGINSIYLDNSLSMQNTTDNQRYIDLAVIKLEDLLNQLKSNSNLQLITNEFSGEDQLLKTGASLKDDLTSLDFGNTPRTLNSIFKRQQNTVTKEAKGSKSNFFWISDFQKSTAGNLKDITIDSLTQLYIVPVKGAVNSNIFIDSVWLQTPFVREMQNNTLLVKFSNSGSKEVLNLPVRLKIDGTQSSGSSVSIPANSSATASFNFTVRDKGEHTGEVNFEDQPITFDNSYFFAVTASPAIKVLHLYNELSQENYVSKLYQNDSLFNFQSFNVNNVDVSKMSTYDLVILEGINNYNGNLTATAKAFVEKGGSLAILPSSKADSNSLNALVGSYGIKVNGVNNAALDPTKQIAIAYPETKNPFFADVFDQNVIPKNVALPLSQAKLSWSGVGEILLQLNNSQRFLSLTKSGKGSVYLFAAPLDKNYGNFAEHAFFVPTFLKMAANSVKASALAFQLSDENIVIDINNAAQNGTYKLDREGNEIIPIQQVKDGKLYLQLPANSDLPKGSELLPGYYNLTLNGETIKTLALNSDSKESRMDYYTPEELREAFANFPNVKVFDGLLESDFVETFKNENIGRSFWSYFLYGALLFILLEILLVRFMKG